MAQGFIWPLLLPIAAKGACLSGSFDVRSGADHLRGVSSFLSFRTSPSKCAASSSSLDALETNSPCLSLCSLANSTANDAAVRHSKPWCTLSDSLFDVGEVVRGHFKLAKLFDCRRIGWRGQAL